MKTPFLQKIAEAFHREYGNQVSDMCFVFPSRRAGLFFQKYLAEQAGKPVFSPKVETIASFYESLSPLTVEDRLGLLFRLYRCFKKLNPDEKFDNFVWLGETILSDFNDVDNHLVPAKGLFSNIQSLKQLDDDIQLEQEQVEAIQRFWTYEPTNPEEHHHQQKYFGLWSRLYDLYTEFNKDLEANSLTYSGHLHRTVVENDLKELPYTQVVFVGFSAMSEADIELFKKLKAIGKADFYWDYESSIIQDENNRASRFYENSRSFPSKLTIEANAGNPKIHCVNLSSDIGQVKYTYEILKNLPKVDMETAVVLADENLLVPMLSSIPKTDASGNEIALNVTMSYPLKNSTILNLLDCCMSMQRDYNNDGFWFKQVLAVLQHTHMQCTMLKSEADKLAKELIKENISRIPAERFEGTPLDLFFERQTPQDLCSYLLKIINWLFENSSNTNSWDREFMLQSEREIRRIQSLLQANTDVVVEMHTLQRLLGSLLQSAETAFKGEPLGGLQVMGMLETRCLDFSKLIICSFNEGTFPKSSTPQSLIPYELRKPFHLPTSEFQDAIFAYHFYHLLQRSDEVWLIYNSNSEGVKTGEESRYIKQLRLLYPNDFEISDEQVTFSTGKPNEINLAVKKDGQVMKQLYDYLNNKTLSASSLKTWMECQLRFYYQYLLKIKQPEELEEYINKSQMGNIVHYALQQIYQPFAEKNLSVTRQALERIKPRIKDYLQEAIAKEYGDHQLKGFNLLIYKLMLQLIEKVIDKDLEQTPFAFIAAERPIDSDKVQLATGDPHCPTVRFSGQIDRIDCTNDRWRICDYKTGKADEKPEFKKLFDRKNANKVKEYFQLLLYIWAYDKECDTIAEGHIYRVSQVKSKNNSTLVVERPDRDTLKNFESQLLDEIKRMLHPFDPDNPDDPDNFFLPTAQKEPCSYCNYKLMCNKWSKK